MCALCACVCLCVCLAALKAVAFGKSRLVDDLSDLYEIGALPTHTTLFIKAILTRQVRQFPCVNSVCYMLICCLVRYACMPSSKP